MRRTKESLKEVIYLYIFNIKVSKHSATFFTGAHSTLAFLRFHQLSLKDPVKNELFACTESNTFIT